MKSKSFSLKTKSPEGKLNKTFDFTGYYKTAAETNKDLENSNVVSNALVVNKLGPKSKDSKRERSPKKKRNKIDASDISAIDIEGSSFNSNASKATLLNESKVTSTPQCSQKNQTTKVKSIIKKSLVPETENLDDSEYIPLLSKPKKRNKSVSFMLEESEQVAVKKTKSNESILNKASNSKKVDSAKEKRKKFKLKKDMCGKENKLNSNINMETLTGTNKATQAANETEKNLANKEKEEVLVGGNLKIGKQNKKRKLKNKNNPNTEECISTGTTTNNNQEQIDSNKQKKIKKKKRTKPTVTETELNDGPHTKLRKENMKTESIAENLENLNIGDNAHTLTNLLDDMTVADKEKRKKNKRKMKNEKNTATATNIEIVESEKTEEEKEKVKWNKRKWNKDKKGKFDEDSLPTSVIIENLPLSMMCGYKKILSDHFGKHGIIKYIGVAEVYPTEESKPVFTTTINFYSDGAASKALEENNTMFEGSRICVRQPLPPTQTTVVVRSYGDLTEQALSTTFLPAGKIRNIRLLVKGKKAIATAFIEFDGPEALEKAMKLGQEARIGGKKLHVSKFEIRKKKKKTRANSENEEDSESSNE